MLSKTFEAKQAIDLLDLKDRTELDRAVAEGGIEEIKKGKTGARFRLADLIVFRLAAVMGQVGVETQKAFRYAEAVLGQRLRAHDKNPLDWIENEQQELFCFIEDGQLTRIFLRAKEDPREVDVGAVKPVLFPTTRTEINVFRVIRPVLVKVRHLDDAE
ncbi:MAG: hypothetical protein HY913_05755 [Desulfomonile tiedjei]|nr:hypothetical protein [Desulfomonile tiedjei]